MSFTLLAALIGCKNGYQGDLNGDENVEIAAPIADFDWDPDGLVLSIRQGEGYDFLFGFMQSGDCEEDNELGCWTGESCVGYGYVSPDASFVIEGSTCHPAGSTGATLTYSEAGVAGLFDVPATTQIVPGQTTAFNNSSYETSVTYYLTDTVSGKCWVWGAEPSVYDDLTTTACSIPSDEE